MRTEEIARIVHAANRELQVVNKEEGISPLWNFCPDWQRDSATAGVLVAITGDKSPEEMHNEWSKYKLADGWTYGPVKNGDLKTHPCLVPYSQLPESQQLKDKLFLAIVNALA